MSDVKLLFSNPTKFFKKVVTHVTPKRIVLGVLVIALLYGLMDAAVSYFAFPVSELGMYLPGTSKGTVALLTIVGSLLSVPSLFIGAALIHIGVRIVKGKEGFAETLKVLGIIQIVTYIASAAMLVIGVLMVVAMGQEKGYVTYSIIAAFLGLGIGIYMLILEVIGLKVAQKLTMGKAILAILIPIVIFVGVFIGIGIFVGLLSAIL